MRLKVGGVTPLTSIDYPGELAAVIYCQGCHWRCRYCHNIHLLPRVGLTEIGWTDVLDFARKRIGLLDAVVFSGGEPTLHSSLPVAIQQIKQLGYKIGLHTAGCHPKRLRKILHLIDWVGLDIKGLPPEYPSITQTQKSGKHAWESLEAIQASGVDYEVRTTHIPGSPDSTLLDLANALKAKGVRKYALQTCRTHTTLDPSLGNMLACPPAPRLVRQLQQQFPGLVLR